MIHSLTENDLPALLELSQEVGWEHTLQDWQALLRAGCAFGHRNQTGQPVSSLVLTDFGPRMGALGMLIVCEKNRRLGLAKDLLRHVIGTVNPANRPLLLVSGSKVEGLYKKFGFKTVETISKLQGQAGTPVPDSGFADKIDLSPLDDSSLMRVFGLDHQVHAYDRSGMLKARLPQARAQFVALKHGAETLLGYGWGVVQGEQLLVGPLIGFNRFTAQEILRAVTGEHAGPVRIDVPHQRRDFIETLLALGYEELDRQPIMLLGADTLPGRRDHVFALASQAWT